MSPTRCGSLDSQSSRVSYRSVEIPDSERANRHDEQSNIAWQGRSPRGTSRSRLPRVHFGSESMEKKANTDTAPQGGQPSYGYRSPNISEPPSTGHMPFYDDSSQSENTLGQWEKSSPEPEHAIQPNPPEPRLQKNSGHSILRKIRFLVARLYKPSSDYRGASDRSEHESEDLSASLQAHQLVRGLVYDQSDEHRTARSQANPMPEPVTQRRESEGGVLAQLLKLYGGLDPPTRDTRSHSNVLPAVGTPSTPFGGSRSSRKKMPKWYEKPQNMPMDTTTNSAGASGWNSPMASREMLSATPRRAHIFGRHMRLEDEIRVTIHIADIISRQRYIIQLCKAFMMFGAPMHRLEEHMQKTAFVLDVDSQFLYVPGCMIMSFDDPTTRTTEVKLVRVAQGIDLGLLADTHDVYKNVVHDVMGVEEATSELEEIMNRKSRYNKWIIVIVYGLASAMVGPFAFNARPIDMPIIFFNGALLGILQHVLAPRSVLYSNVFEVTASVLTSFIARALGSIDWTTSSGNRERLFCFSAVAQSSIALILPGYTVLSSSLELQSHQLVAGSIRMVYAFIYSLFLGYGITVGTTIYGLIDPNATSDLTCPSTGAWDNEYVQRFPFVAAFVLCLLVINQGRWKQAPVMLFIAESGYIVTYFVTQRIGTSSQVANTVGAFTIGMMGNLYSRLWHGHAATSILPGIFVLVPSGLAASGPIISGIKSADETRDNVSSAINHTSYTIYSVESSQLYTADLGFGMVEVSIGITVGLFIAALMTYPFGKRRSGLFSF
ncbi:hypothetical protein N7513_007376 [Penicillium frequentans]|nr:hypothetical protein N7513_007376 [Penicillium glabrum]